MSSNAVRRWVGRCGTNALASTAASSSKGAAHLAGAKEWLAKNLAPTELAKAKKQQQHVSLHQLATGLARGGKGAPVSLATKSFGAEAGRGRLASTRLSESLGCSTSAAISEESRRAMTASAYAGTGTGKGSGSKQNSMADTTNNAKKPLVKANLLAKSINTSVRHQLEQVQEVAEGKHVEDLGLFPHSTTLVEDPSSSLIISSSGEQQNGNATARGGSAVNGGHLAISQLQLLQVMEHLKDKIAMEPVVLDNDQSFNMRLTELGSNNGFGLGGDLARQDSSYKALVSTSAASDAEYFENSRWEKLYHEVSRTIPQEKNKQQLELEGEASVRAAQEYTDAWNEACERGGAAQMGPLNNLMVAWHGALTEKIRGIVGSVSKSRANPGTRKACAEPFLSLLSADELSYLTINAALTWTLQKHRRTLDHQSSVMPCSVRKAKIAEFLGRAVETEVGLKIMKEKIRGKIRNKPMMEGEEETIYTGVKESRASKRNKGKFKRDLELEINLQRIVGKLDFEKPQRMDSIVRYLVHCNNTFFDENQLPTWGIPIQVKVGAKLVDLLVETAMVTRGESIGLELEGSPAFKFERLGHGRSTHWNGLNKVNIKKQAEFLVCSEEMLKKIENHLEILSFLHPKYMPMVVPPIPWTSAFSGGYLTHKTFVMRVRGSKLQRKMLKEADQWKGDFKLRENNGNDNDFASLGGLASPLDDDSLASAAAASSYDEGAEFMMEDESGAQGVYHHEDVTHQLDVGDLGLDETEGESFSAGSYKRKGMSEVYDALNSLGWTSWRINKKVFGVVDKVWNSDMEELRQRTELPSRTDNEMIPEPAARFRMVSSKHNLTFGTLSESSYENALRTRRNNELLRENRENYSQKCDFLYKFDTAKKYIEEDAIYFPHNMDFRGRAYPMHPYLNHLGSDLCRSMLKFSDAKPMGDRGLRWLFIHVANLRGANKMSLDSREEYSKNSLDAILDSAKNPLGGSRWWADAENPYQCLATCFEIAEALESGSPATFASSIPVHQDGSCNGLQHYAALSRDEEGARSVNLLPCDAPYDVYSRVAALVAEAVEKHAHDPSSAYHREAINLLGEVDRKLVKQTVMTSVYGVTFIGARQQIASRLKERGWTDKDKIYVTSRVAAKLTMNALDKAFKNAKETMRWLGDCASIISKSGEPVSWTTPLGLPVAQPYRRKKKFVVITNNQRLILQKSNEADPVSPLKQRTAFPPNYVHSLDSSHLLMTASECHQRGITFAGVHDSFWTHASSIDEMNTVLREKFIDLHKQPLLENLLNEFQAAHPKLRLPPVPELGPLDLEHVKDAPYFFS